MSGLPTERERALEVLARVERSAYALFALEDDAARFGASNFVRTVVLGVLRWRSRLDYAIERLARRPVSGIDSSVLQILRCAVYELMEMRSPAYAVVSEAVESAGKRVPRARSFCNAVLRAAAAANLATILPDGDSLEAMAVKTAHPEWLLKRWTESFGRPRAMAIARANQRLSYPDIVVNARSAAARGEIEERLETSSSTLVDHVLKLRESTASLADLIEAGLVWPMDEGSALVASMASSAGGPILDLAAAPGGKSLYMTMRGEDVTSLDISLRRLQPLRSAGARAFLDRAPRIVVGDGRFPPFRKSFRTVLVDAPCSATGTIRKSPEIKWRIDLETIGKFPALQLDLLCSALALTDEVCIYSTCSLEGEENDAVVTSALEGNTDFQRDDLGRYATAGALQWIDDGVLRLTPESGADGFTAFALRRVRSRGSE
jgi:16S rRNA (cytosine967-C5)-methyltransferase